MLLFFCFLGWAKVVAYLLEKQESTLGSGGPLHHPAVALSACIILVPQKASVVVGVEFKEEEKPICRVVFWPRKVFHFFSDPLPAPGCSAIRGNGVRIGQVDTVMYGAACNYYSSLSFPCIW